MLSTVRPRQLLFGKVVGIGLVGLIQLTLVGAVGLITVMKTHAITVPSLGVTAVLGGLLWFLLGFLFYALIYAAAGSMITRQEDAAAVTVPIYPTLLGWQIEYILNDSAAVAVICSTGEQLQKIQEIRSHAPHIHNIIVCDPPEAVPLGVRTFRDIRSQEELAWPASLGEWSPWH